MSAPTGLGGQFSATAQAEAVVEKVEEGLEKLGHERNASSTDEDDIQDENEKFSSSSSDRDTKVSQLVRTFTQKSVRHADGELVNPFISTDNPILDPSSEQFNSRAWAKTLVGITSRDPERYPTRVAGVAYKNLNVHGFGTPTDYQKTFGNAPLELSSFPGRVTGKGKTKIQILRDFDGLVKSGEMLVVLGRPGRYEETAIL